MKVGTLTVIKAINSLFSYQYFLFSPSKVCETKTGCILSQTASTSNVCLANKTDSDSSHVTKKMKNDPDLKTINGID